jgi:predicted DNA-binding protein YlxM (UPF0122 family)
MVEVSSLREFFILAGCVCIAVVFLLLAWLYGRTAKSKRSQPAAPLSNLTEIAILFQTMRGVIHEQKTLAREFNESVDKKVQLIRQVVKRVLEEHEKLTQVHHELARRLESVKADVDRIQGRVANAREEVLGVSAPILADSKPLHAVAPPVETDSGHDLIDNWVGLDFVADETEPESMEDLDLPVQSPQSHEASRQAMRALLNIPGNGGGRPVGDSALPDGGNGRNRGSLRTRVFDYYDAGMSVAQIAQELGVGKGEIRLMLSLRDKGKKD